MDLFPRDALVCCVFYEPGPSARPLVIVVGVGAQALADDLPQLSSVLDRIGVRERRLHVHSRHAEALLLHVADEAAGSIAWHYGVARGLVADLWEAETATALRDATITPLMRSWWRALVPGMTKLPPVARELRSIPGDLFPGRFPRDEPLRAKDHSRWLCALGRYEKACALIERHLQAHPDDGEAHFALGGVYSDLMKQPQRGVEHLRRAAELAPDRTEVWNKLGMALTKVDRDDEACAAFLRAGELAKDFSPWMNLASAQLRMGRMADAQAAAHRARELGEKEPLPFFVLSLCARHDHDEVGARYLLTIAEQVLQALPADAREQLEKVRFVQEARRRGTPALPHRRAPAVDMKPAPGPVRASRTDRRRDRSRP